MKKLSHFLLIIFANTIFAQSQAAKDYVSNASLKFVEQNFKGAIEDCTKAIQLEPNYAFAFILRGTLKFNLEDFDGSKFDFNKAIELEPNNAGYYNTRGILYKDLEDYKRALADFSKAIELSPQFDNALLNRGELKWVLKDYNDAIADLDKVIILKPDLPYLIEAYLYRQSCRYSIKDYYGSISDLTKVIELKPEKPNLAVAFKYRGNAKNQLGNLKEACGDWKKASELGDEGATKLVENNCSFVFSNLKTAEDFHKRGGEFLNKEKYKNALVDFNKAIELKPNFAKAIFGRACVKYKTNDYYGAITDCSKLIDLELVFDPLIYFIRGHSKIQLLDYEGACEDFKKADELGVPLAAEAITDYCK